MATTGVDYPDFSLVFKAFHLKENAPNGMICRCGLDKEDTVLFEDEERDDICYCVSESITVNSDYVYNSATFRALQTLLLFFQLNSTDSKPTTGPYALKLLWNSITEPFLRQEEFKKSVKAIQPFDRTTAAWDWYASQVLENVISPRGPRSLAHLSRCSVRRQLATCLQLPCGVDQLHVPKILKDYILLKH
nr:uncharacterized protein LOC107450773 isoform X3 [Parasteatoda tepidariorum]